MIEEKLRKMEALVAERECDLNEAIDSVVAELLKIKEVRPCSYKAERAISVASCAVYKLGDAAQRLDQKLAQLRLLYNLQAEMES